MDAGVSQVCEAFGRCCGAGGYAFGRTACESSVRQRYAQRTCADGSFFDAQAADACLAQIAEAMSRCPPDQDIPVCARICTGRKPLGAPCAATRECARDDRFEVLCRAEGGAMMCAPERAAKDATCRETAGRTTLGERIAWPSGGQSSDGGVCYYDDGLYCDPQNRCAPLVPLGGACERDVACGPGGRCQPEQHTCVPAVRVGEPCWDYWACEDNAYCADSIRICEARKPAGEHCTFERQCLGACLSGTCGNRPPKVFATPRRCSAGIF
jgi:hypothetical protein